MWPWMAEICSSIDPSCLWYKWYKSVLLLLHDWWPKRLQFMWKGRLGSVRLSSLRFLGWWSFLYCSCSSREHFRDKAPLNPHYLPEQQQVNKVRNRLDYIKNIWTKTHVRYNFRRHHSVNIVQPKMHRLLYLPSKTEERMSLDDVAKLRLEKLFSSVLNNHCCYREPVWQYLDNTSVCVWLRPNVTHFF